MSLVKRNILANLLGSGWIIGLTILTTPLQINILGIEAYGLVGFIATLQMAFTVFDLGLSSTITRELAADHSPGRTHSIALIRTGATIYWIFALVVGITLVGFSDSIARDWFKAKQIDVSLLAQGLRVIALYLALRWPVALYIGILSGLQRMDILNTVKVLTASARLGGGIVVLLIWRDLQALLWWMSFNAFVEVLAYAFVCQRAYSAMPWRPGMSWPALKAVWRFSLSMSALAVLAMLIVQLDRLMISKMLTLDVLGYYSLAYNTSAGITVLIASISSAVFPSFAAAYSEGTPGVLLRRYDNANRVVLFVAGCAVFALIFFGNPILSLWTNPAAAAGAWQPMALLAAGFWWSAAISNAYNVSVASGNPNWPLKVNLLIAVPYAVGLYWMIGRFGINGAAGTWLLLNLSYALILVPKVHRTVLRIGTLRWFFRTLLPFMLLGTISFAFPRLVVDSLVSHNTMSVELVALAFAILVYAILGYFLLGSAIRIDVLTLVGLAKVSRTKGRY